MAHGLDRRRFLWIGGAAVLTAVGEFVCDLGERTDAPVAVERVVIDERLIDAEKRLVLWQRETLRPRRELGHGLRECDRAPRVEDRGADIRDAERSAIRTAA